ncbi:nucleoside triphosphate pyrophosphohydrolase [Caldisalinibacter kiritimatiensis]|uniref:Nucleoside triphosphate pyrophosphohydrolase MazG n=1 Tax=Caldisalinibacter kiritimatiensis TaxID=1304284 RepID=R1AT91_9FIRM|nr:nucleoside triphosphate pyrophosphohydrolase [Caldisalinibacter kiritimatiensis]EOD00348.1 Nucleoside triphosphate pyrophosphohydrolase MazG [Caldisalinibacter kiritimatiensis]
MSKINVIGLGPGKVDEMSLKAVNTLTNGSPIYLRTERHPVTDYLKEEGIKYNSYDYVYEQEEDFDKVYEIITEDLIEKAKQYDIINYGVPGNPFIGENTVFILNKFKNECKIEIEVIPSISFLEKAISTIGFDISSGFKVLDSLSFEEYMVDINSHNIISQVYDQMVASEAKLKLMEVYDDDYEIYIIKISSNQNKEIVKIPLFEIDRIDNFDYFTYLYIPRVDNSTKKRYNMNNLISIMERLRSKKGCPWDMKQTHESLREYVLEEAYEVVDAIDSGDIDSLVEELGDLLLQVVFHAQIGSEEGYFNIWDVTSGICDKLIYRHPHVFGEVKADDLNEAKSTWDKMKDKEKSVTSYTDRLKNLPKSLSSLMKSYKIQERAADVGFDWDSIDGAIDKAKEEYKELIQEYNNKDNDKIEEELGDLLFAIVNVARFLKINPEVALNKTINKFIERFEYIEKESVKQGKDLKSMSLEEMDLLWEQAKTQKNKK